MPPKSSLQEQTYRRLREQIVHGAIEPGQRLSEPELAMMFGVSRSPIREAVQRLERDGFLTRGPSGRVSVAPLELDEVRHLYVVRANLEGLATRLAAARLRTIDLDEMRDALARSRETVAAAEPGGDGRHGEAFHSVILRECENEPLRELLRHLGGRITRFRTLAHSFETYDLARLDEHQTILDALYGRDAELAERRMVHHIEQSGAVLLRNIERRLAEREAAAKETA